MRNKRCSFCNDYQEVVYEDQTISGKPKIYINICWKCFTEFKIGIDLTKSKIACIKENPENYSENTLIILESLKKVTELFPKMILCSDCQEKFIPVKETQRTCYACYKKKKNKNFIIKIETLEGFG